MKGFAVIGVSSFVPFLAACASATRVSEDSAVDGDVDAEPVVDADSVVDADVERDAASDADNLVDGDVVTRCAEDMVEVPGTGWCIDRYECAVDEAGRAYAQEGRVPALEMRPPEIEAACLAAGKELCPEDVWVAACTRSGERLYPYGNSYHEGFCNGDQHPEEYVSAGSFPRCSGGYPGLFDMSGNAWEMCARQTEPGSTIARFPMRGGAASSFPHDLACEAVFWTDELSGGVVGGGFRCCRRL